MSHYQYLSCIICANIFYVHFGSLQSGFIKFINYVSDILLMFFFLFDPLFFLS